VITYLGVVHWTAVIHVYNTCWWPVMRNWIRFLRHSVLSALCRYFCFSNLNSLLKPSHCILVLYVNIMRCTDRALADYWSANNRRLTIGQLPINTKSWCSCMHVFGCWMSMCVITVAYIDAYMNFVWVTCSPHNAGVKRLNRKIKTVRETNLQYTLAQTFTKLN